MKLQTNLVFWICLVVRMVLWSR